MAFASVAAATVGFADQDSVEPQASKTRYWEGKDEARTRTTHILPSLSMRKNAPLCDKNRETVESRNGAFLYVLTYYYVLLRITNLSYASKACDFMR